MKKAEYQKELSIISTILLDEKYKEPKVNKMLSILWDYGMIGAEKKSIAIDVGCSGGFFISSLSSYFFHIIGVDIDDHALSYALARNKYSNLYYVNGDSMKLPFPDNSVDLVLCNHVYEHVPDPYKLFSEIYRVLNDKGVCYLGAASRLTPIEPHYHLLFLSWLPKVIAHRYMRLMKKGDYYYENLRTYWGIKSLIKDFEVLDYTLKVIGNPDKYSARDLLPEGGIMTKIPYFVWKIFYYFLPTYIFILKKQYIK